MPLAIRDALGLARLLYAAEAGHADRAASVASAGRLLAEAHRLAGMAPGSLGQRAAGPNAVKALDALRAVGWPAEVEALLDVARERVAQAGR